MDDRFQQPKQNYILISDTSLTAYELPNGDYYKGAYDSKGLRHGYGLYVFRNGTKYLGNYYHGTREGYGLMSFPDNAKYAGTWKHNLKNGYGRYTYKNGDLYEGQWKENKRHGVGAYYYSMGKEMYCFYGTWINDERNGPGEINFKTFQLYAIFKDQCPIGPAVFTFGDKWMCSGYFLKEMTLVRDSPSFWVPQCISKFDAAKIPQRPEPNIDLSQLEAINSTSSFSSWLFSVVNSEEYSFSIASSEKETIPEVLEKFKIVEDIASSLIRIATTKGVLKNVLPNESMLSLKSAIVSMKSFLHMAGSQTGLKESAEITTFTTSVDDVIRNEDKEGPFIGSTLSLACPGMRKKSVSFSASSFKKSTDSIINVSKRCGRLQSDEAEPEHKGIVKEDDVSDKLKIMNDFINSIIKNLIVKYGDSSKDSSVRDGISLQSEYDILREEQGQFIDSILSIANAHVNQGSVGHPPTSHKEPIMSFSSSVKQDDNMCIDRLKPIVEPNVEFGLVFEPSVISNSIHDIASLKKDGSKSNHKNYKSGSIPEVSVQDNAAASIPVISVTAEEKLPEDKVVYSLPVISVTAEEKLTDDLPEKTSIPDFPSMLNEISHDKKSSLAVQIDSQDLGQLIDLKISSAGQLSKESLKVDETAPAVNKDAMEQTSNAHSDTESIFAVLNRFEMVDDITNSIIEKVMNDKNTVENIEKLKSLHPNMEYIFDIIIKNVFKDITLMATCN